jgi:hypothetical protein
MASSADLSDWNRRVRRLANDYPRKYRPIVLSLGYHVNLDEGLSRTYIRVDTIVRESARYTASGQPLQKRYVKRLLAELEKAGAIKSEARWSEDTGRQVSSWRTLITAVSVDRYGFTRAHDFWAPFPQVDEKKDTPRDTPEDTPRDTPEDTPRDTRTNLGLSEIFPVTAHHHQGFDGGESSGGPSNLKPSLPVASGDTPSPGESSHPCPDHYGESPQNGCDGCVQELTYDLVEVWEDFWEEEEVKFIPGVVESLVRKYGVEFIVQTYRTFRDHVEDVLVDTANVRNPAAYTMFLLDQELLIAGFREGSR